MNYIVSEIILSIYIYMYISIKYLYGVVSRNDKIGKLKQVEVRQGAGKERRSRGGGWSGTAATESKFKSQK